MNKKGIILIQILILIALIEIGLLTTQVLLKNYKERLEAKSQALNVQIQGMIN